MAPTLQASPLPHLHQHGAVSPQVQAQGRQQALHPTPSTLCPTPYTPPAPARSRVAAGPGPGPPAGPPPSTLHPMPSTLHPTCTSTEPCRRRSRPRAASRPSTDRPGMAPPSSASSPVPSPGAAKIRPPSRPPSGCSSRVSSGCSGCSGRESVNARLGADDVAPPPLPRAGPAGEWLMATSRMRCVHPT